MTIIRILLKLLLLPVVVAVTLLEWVGIFLMSFSSIIFFILSGIVFLIAVLSFIFQIAPGAEVLKMLIIGFVVFIVPHIGEWIVDRISDLHSALRGFIRA